MCHFDCVTIIGFAVRGLVLGSRSIESMTGAGDTWDVRVTRGRWAWHNDEGGPGDTWDVGG